jgi:hypothetical protein
MQVRETQLNTGDTEFTEQGKQGVPCNECTPKANRGPALPAEGFLERLN